MTPKLSLLDKIRLRYPRSAPMLLTFIPIGTMWAAYAMLTANSRLGAERALYEPKMVKMVKRRGGMEEEVMDESMAFVVTVERLRDVLQRIAVKEGDVAMMPLEEVPRNDFFVQKHANGMKFVKDVCEKELKREKGKLHL